MRRIIELTFPVVDTLASILAYGIQPRASLENGRSRFFSLSEKTISASFGTRSIKFAHTDHDTHVAIKRDQVAGNVAGIVGRDLGNVGNLSLVKIDTVDLPFGGLACTCIPARFTPPEAILRPCSIKKSSMRSPLAPPHRKRYFRSSLGPICLTVGEIHRRSRHCNLSAPHFHFLYPYLFEKFPRETAEIHLRHFAQTKDTGRLIVIMMIDEQGYSYHDPVALLSYPGVVKIPTRSLPIPLDERERWQCTSSRNAKRLLSATLLI